MGFYKHDLHCFSLMFVFFLINIQTVTTFFGTFYHGEGRIAIVCSVNLNSKVTRGGF